MTNTEYVSALKQLVADPSLQPRDGKTYCNFFMQKVFDLFLIKYPTIGGRPLLANEFCDWLVSVSSGKEADKLFEACGSLPQWGKISSDKADALPAKLIIAAQKAKPRGHICVIHPGPMVTSTKWGAPGKPLLVPQCANVGKSCFMGKGLNWAFATQPEIFVSRA